MNVLRKTDNRNVTDLEAQVALLKDQLMTAQAMLEAEAKARIALEKIIEARPEP